MDNPRKVAVKTLLKIERDNAYSNISLASALKEAELSAADKALASALVYGVLDRKLTLDYVLAQFMKSPLKKTAPFTLAVLRTALYQIMYMDKIPESAAVDEAVKLIKKSRESRNSGFVNAVLRKILREKYELPSGESVNALSIKYSCSEWIIDSFIKDYGMENTEKLLSESLKAAPLCIRVNTLKTNSNDLINEFEKTGVALNEGAIENSLCFSKGIDIANNTLFNKGYFHVQDIASQTVTSVLNPESECRVLDMCAAPGGKSCTLAEIMKNKGEIISCDIYDARVGLIADNAKRLGVNIIKPTLCDATEYDSRLGEFDCVLCDVPCSGLGVIRRKPEVKYKEKQDLSELEEIQYKILCNAVRYLKKGGKLLYSTCTLRRAENENLVIRFQKEYNNFRKVYEHTYMPHIDGTDGFYCALLIKE